MSADPLPLSPVLKFIHDHGFLSYLLVTEPMCAVLLFVVFDGTPPTAYWVISGLACLAIFFLLDSWRSQLRQRRGDGGDRP